MLEEIPRSYNIWINTHWMNFKFNLLILNFLFWLAHNQVDILIILNLIQFKCFSIWIYCFHLQTPTMQWLNCILKLLMMLLVIFGLRLNYIQNSANLIYQDQMNFVCIPLKYQCIPIVLHKCVFALLQIWIPRIIDSY